MTRSTTESVLLSAKYSPSCYVCLRSLAERGVRTVVVSPHEGVPAFASRYCEESIVVPSPNDDLLAYRDALLSVADRPEVAAFVPIWEEDAYLLGKYGEAFGARVGGAWPDFETLRSVQDRLRLAEVAADAGVAVPTTQSFDDVDDWDRERILKSRYNLLAGEYVDSFSERDAELNKTLKYLAPGEEPDPETVYAALNHVPIAQETVTGGADEYAFIALYDRGEPVATYQKHQIRAKTYAGGTSVYRESVAVPALERAGRALLGELDWHGLAEVEFLRDPETGEFELMEVNPRMWASVACAIEAGADFPYYYWRLATGEADGIDDEYAVGTGNHSLFGELQHLSSVLRDDYPDVERPAFDRRLWEIAASCYSQPNFDYLRLDDPGPFVRGVRDAVRL
ncbi:carboxylate--amine ligase [Halorussus marinus]|uniref:carboxylate--amine ligase n=1 Tax=Halorussus marinus TaxID=2505976 RepID=UPI00106DF73C|nr:carboxylate--amine ligase [Halorussus marinus]